MIVRTLAVGALLAFAASAAGAQSSVCPPGTTGPLGIPDANRATQDACQLAVDVFQVVAPQLALAVTGGNATLGQGGTLGGFGKVLLGVRANVLSGTLPQIQEVELSTTGRVQRSGSNAVRSERQIIGLPALEAALGLFRGIPLGVTNVGGIDLLASATFVPDIETDAVQVSTDSPLKLGYGARVGLLQESLIIPGLAFTWFRRDLPTATIRGATDDGDELEVRNLRVQTTAWRVVASKTFLMFGLIAGAGQDKYDASTTVQASVQPRGLPGITEPFRSAAIPMEQELTRTNIFGDVSFNLPFAKIVLEVGRVSGGQITTYNQFTGKAPDDPLVYGALGLRVGF
jgi:hypothetical protein